MKAVSEMEKKLYDLCDWARIEAVVYAEEDRPCEILGAHLTTEGILIQAFFPEVESVSIRTAAGADIPMIREDEALTHPRRNVITRCLGIECQPPEIRSSSGPIRPGEIFLLCSDGLWEALTPAAIRQILASPQSLGEKARALVRSAAENGSADNITACLCSCPGGEPAREEEPFILD